MDNQNNREQILKGYDICVEKITNEFFQNLTQYNDNFIASENIAKELIENEEKQAALKQIMQHFLEMKREELIEENGD